MHIDCYTVLQLYGGGTGRGAQSRGWGTLCSARRLPCVADGTAHLMTCKAAESYFPPQRRLILSTILRAPYLTSLEYA
jgi:hypothetical protein